VINDFPSDIAPPSEFFEGNIYSQVVVNQYVNRKKSFSTIYPDELDSVYSSNPSGPSSK
jgi:hypothetical protein